MFFGLVVSVASLIAMFKFDFDIEDAEKEEDIQNIVGTTPQNAAPAGENIKQAAFKAESLTELVRALSSSSNRRPTVLLGVKYS